VDYTYSTSHLGSNDALPNFSTLGAETKSKPIYDYGQGTSGYNYGNDYTSDINFNFSTLSKVELPDYR